MKIYVNNDKIPYDPKQPISWGEFIQVLLEKHVKKNHGITKITLDGQNRSEVLTQQMSNNLPDNIQILEITTKDSYSITQDGFSKAYTLIESIREEVNKTADLYRSGEIKDASNRIIKVMEAIRPIINFINSVGMNFSLNFDNINFDQTTTLREKIETFHLSLQELIAAQQKKDYVEIADFLEYQLSDDLQEWHKVLQILLKAVESKSGEPE